MPNHLADEITTRLRTLVGQQMDDCWRAANMQIFEFGPRRTIVNRQGQTVEVGQFSLHLQCRWRMVDGAKIIFGSDDLHYPADASIPWDQFDWDKHESVLDAAQRQWFASHRDSPLAVMDATGDAYGGFRITLEGGIVLEAFPCRSRSDVYSEQWRLLNDADGSHFVVTGYGIEPE